MRVFEVNAANPKPNLADQHAELTRLRNEWLAAIATVAPGCRDSHWFRAVAAARGENARRNDDTSKDAELAGSAVILMAFNTYKSALHAFYRARDGEHGFLGGRGA